MRSEEETEVTFEEALEVGSKEGSQEGPEVGRCSKAEFFRGSNAGDPPNSCFFPFASWGRESPQEQAEIWFSWLCAF